MNPKSRRRSSMVIPSAFVWVALAACNMPGSRPTPDFATAAAQTVQARLTLAVEGTPGLVLPVTETPSPPVASETPTWTPGSPTQVSCTNKAGFVDDVTVPDNTNIPPGDQFDKTWRLRNDGTCVWTTNYSLVFEGGNIMAGPATVPFSTTVVHGGTVDLTVTLTAPTSNGTYRGDWMLRDDRGVKFGLGANYDRPFFVQIVVGPTPVPEPVVVYNFVNKRCDAAWTSGAGTLSCNGNDTDTSGFVIKLDSPKFENGVTDDEPALWTHPEWVNDGFIRGLYPEFTIKSGDRFLTIIGCKFNANDCDVKFQLRYKDDGGTFHALGEWTQTYDTKINKLDVDLSLLDGETVQFELAVLANGPAAQDWALWLLPRIAGPPR